MDLLFKNKKLLFSLTILVVVTIFIIGLSVVNLLQPGTRQPSQFPTPTPNNGPFFIRSQNNESAGISISPSTTHVLVPGTKESFVVSLPSSLSLEDITISLTVKDFRSDSSPINSPITTSSEKQGEVKIDMGNNVVAYGEYKLTIENKSGEGLIEATYLSDTIDRVQTNNQELSRYLPHETTNYRLIYIKERNLYIFNFKINDNSTIPPQQQFENAQNEATQFIESKGIDINSIVIEWRFS